jgi:hypothetical protein
MDAKPFSKKSVIGCNGLDVLLYGYRTCLPVMCNRSPAVKIPSKRVPTMVRRTLFLPMVCVGRNGPCSEHGYH